MKNKELKPTTEQFNTYQALYDYFNAHLFDGELPGIILNFSRKGGACGFFAPNRWHRGETKTHEISINPTHLRAIRLSKSLRPWSTSRPTYADDPRPQEPRARKPRPQLRTRKRKLNILARVARQKPGESPAYK